MKSYFLLIPTTLLFISCSTFNSKMSTIKSDDLILPDNFIVVSGPNQVDALQAKKDLEILYYTIKFGYGGRKFVPQQDLAKALSEIESYHNNLTGKISSNDFCLKIDSILSIIPDNHLFPTINYNPCDPIKFKKFEKSPVGKNNSTKAPWDLKYFKINNFKIPILSITKMFSYNKENWGQFSENVKKIKNSAPAIVVDLRGNPGGSDEAAQELSKIMFGQEISPPYSRIITSKVPQTLAVRINTFKIKKSETKEEYKKDIQNRIDAEYEKFLKAKRKELPEEEIEIIGETKKIDSSKVYNRPIMVLIDNACSSACESVLDYLEGLPGLKKVGQNTGGFVHFGNMGKLVLPNSRIMISIATDFWEYKDHRYVEKIGYCPDIKVENGINALDIAKNELEKILKN